MELSEKNRDAITRLAKSSDAQKLMELLQKQSGQVKQAAQQASGGGPGPADGHDGPADAQQGGGGADGPHRQPGQAGGAEITEESHRVI